MAKRCWILFALLFAACRTATVPLSGVDHIILAVPNLERAMADFERTTGVTPVRGGLHPGRGTQNALVSLGNGTYLEIMAPQDQPDVVTDMVKQLQSLTAPTVIGWGARIADASATRASLDRAGFGTTTRAGSRVTPSGATLEWTLVQLDQPLAAGPFFIEWKTLTTHPSLTSPAGCTMSSFDVASPNFDQMNHLLAAGGLSLRARAAERPRLQLMLRCGSRTAEFRSE